tara:strand:- start:376 stop:1284 length:909 start_codon:yes stop_codon:yes gene_type:complete
VDGNNQSNSETTLLFAQVNRGDPEMKIDSEQRLRHHNFPGAEGSLFLGDVANSLLRCFGPHEPPKVISVPGFDQQQWIIEFSDSELSVRIESKSYWGFGLFASCFMNSIQLTGPLNRRARLIFDLSSALGRNPWEAKWSGRFSKKSGVNPIELKKEWDELITKGHADLMLSIDSGREMANALESELPSLIETAPDDWDIDSAKEKITEARMECDIATDALHDRSAKGVERALSRAEACIIEADPRTEVSAQYKGGDVIEEMAAIEADDIDLTDTILEIEQISDEYYSKEEDIPFVDLANEEE